MIIKNCPFILASTGNWCLFYSSLNAGCCQYIQTCPFKSILDKCTAVMNDDSSGTKNQENAKKWVEMFEIETL